MGEALEARQLLAADGLLREVDAAGLSQSQVSAAPLAAPQIEEWRGAAIGATDDSLGQANNAVASDAQGNYVVVWWGTDGIAEWQEELDTKLYAQRYRPDGEKLGAVIELDDAPPDNVKIAMATDGSFVVAWTMTGIRSAPGVSTVYARSFNAAGQQLSEAVLNSEAGEWIEVASLALTDDGFYLAYHQGDEIPSGWWPSDSGQSQPLGTFAAVEPDATPLSQHPSVYDYDSYAQKFSRQGAAIGSRVHLRTWEDVYESDPRENLQIAATGNDEFVSVYSAFTATGDRIYLQRFRDGVLGQPLQISTSEDAGKPAVAVDGEQRVLVAWQQGSVAGGYQILVQRVNAVDQLFASPIVVAQGAEQSGWPQTPALAADFGGRFALTWSAPLAPGQILPTNLSGGVTNLRARVYDATARALGDSFLVSLSSAHGAGKLAFGGSSLTALVAMPELSAPKIGTRTLTIAEQLVVDLNGDPAGVNYRLDYVPGGAAVPLMDTSAATIAGAEQILAATVIIAGYLPGDAIAAGSLVGTNIQASYVGGVMTLTGLDSAANYEAALRGLKFSSTATRSPGDKLEIGIIVGNGTLQSQPALSQITIYVSGSATIAGRHIFYNNSSFDGNDAAAGVSDDAAIATDKVALPVDQLAGTANYTSFIHGINGIMIDLAGELGTITVDDFRFYLGDGSDNPAFNVAAPAPIAFLVRPGVGVGGSTRVHIVWADGAIKNTWLQVNVLANGNTGLANLERFHFGNQIGDIGNDAGQARLNALDAVAVINRLLDPLDTRIATITDAYDFDRSGRINALDALIVINRLLDDDDAPLEFIEVPATTPDVTAEVVRLSEFARSAVFEAAPLAHPAAAFADWNEDEETIELAIPQAGPPLLLEPDDLWT